jgi:hypothetical protein
LGLVDARKGGAFGWERRWLARHSEAEALSVTVARHFVHCRGVLTVLCNDQRASESLTRLTASLSSTSRATTVSMPTPETPPSSPLTVQSDQASDSVSSGDVFVAPDTRRPAAYIELPHLAPEERVKYEAVQDRDLPQDFDYSLPLSDRVIIGEYRDDATLWYYVENDDGIARRVSDHLCLCSPAIDIIPSNFT